MREETENYLRRPLRGDKVKIYLGRDYFVFGQVTSTSYKKFKKYDKSKKEYFMLNREIMHVRPINELVDEDVIRHRIDKNFRYTKFPLIMFDVIYKEYKFTKNIVNK